MNVTEHSPDVPGTLHLVNPETCKGDGICAEVCPQHVLEMVDGKAATVEDRADTCILCGQCVAVCPTDSLRMSTLPMDGLRRLGEQPVGYEAFVELLRHRRSTRVFKDRPVERDLIERIVEAASTAPMGLQPHSTAVVVIDRRDELDFLLKSLVKHYESTVRAFSNPVGRAMIRLRGGAENYRMLRDHVVNVAEFANELYRKDGSDRYLYHAPVLMLFHGDRRAMSYRENAHLVCHHAMLAAVSLGLGTTIIGLIPPIVDRSKALRRRYDIPEANGVMTSLILGHPKYRYGKSIRRELAGVRYV